ncbi:MAG: YbjN domain-containing protein [Gemmataceae bacterium]|nr:YbjN domain-containing protein [Gemmataceae bacterium]
MVAAREQLPMNNRRLDVLIRGAAKPIKGELGYWTFGYKDQVLHCITDEKHNRMRLICPVAEMKDVQEPQLLRCMQANFDSALDARYCVYKEQLWSAFIHPLAELTDHSFLSALDQVATLAHNFGGSYSSGALVFRGWE